MRTRNLIVRRKQMTKQRSSGGRSTTGTQGATKEATREEGGNTANKGGTRREGGGEGRRGNQEGGHPRGSQAGAGDGGGKESED